MPASVPSAGIATADTCPSVPAASAPPAETGDPASESSLSSSDKQLLAFSFLVSKLIMARERIRQAYRPHPSDRAADPFLSGGTSVDGEIARAFELMDAACAAWYSRPTRKTAETAATTEKRRQINLRKLEKAHAQRILSGKLGGRPKKVKK